MSEIDLAQKLKALGDPTRLAIYTFLKSCGCCVSVDPSGAVRVPNGKTVGEVCCHITGGPKIPSSLSFHLKELRQAGLIAMERRGRHLMCGLNREAADALANYFSEARRCGSQGERTCCD